MIDYKKITRNFLLNEGQVQSPDVFSYLTVISELVNSIRPATIRDNRYCNMIKKHIQEVTKHVKKLNEKVTLLEEENNKLNEQLKILEENKKDKK